MNRLAGFSLLALAGCAAWPVAAQQAAPDTEEAHVVFGRWPHEGVCTSENTKAVAFDDLLTHKADYADQCVSTVAWINGRALFARREDAAASGSNFSDALSAVRVGLYGSEKTMQTIWSSNSARVRVVGKLWDCQDLQGPNVVMVMGYCHSTGGPIIGVASFDPLQ